jgi:hypothetical protein
VAGGVAVGGLGEVARRAARCIRRGQTGRPRVQESILHFSAGVRGTPHGMPITHMALHVCQGDSLCVMVMVHVRWGRRYFMAERCEASWATRPQRWRTFGPKSCSDRATSRGRSTYSSPSFGSQVRTSHTPLQEAAMTEAMTEAYQS